MKLYVVWGSRDLEQRIQHATLSEDAEGLNRISQAVSQATEFWRSWAFAIGGEIVWLNGSRGMAKMPADSLDELDEIRGKFADRIGVSVSTGVGLKPSEAERAYRVGEMEGGKIRLYTSEVDDILDSAEKKPLDSVDKLAESHLKHEEDVMDLRKSMIGAAAAMAALPTLAADLTPFHDDLRAIAHLETSFGKNENHARNSHGVFHTALGLVGLKPITAHDEYVHSVALQKEFPGLLDKGVFLKSLRGDSEFYVAVASSHWNRLKKYVKGDLAKTAFAWRWGRGALDNAGPEEVNQDPYVRKFLTIQKSFVDEPVDVVSLINPLRKGSFSPAGPDLLEEGMSASGPASPAIATGAGNAGMAGAKKPAAPTKPHEGSEHSDGEAAAAEAAEAPGVETTHAAKDFQDQLAEMSEDSEDEDGANAQEIENTESADQIRQQVLQVLGQFRQFAPYMEEIKKENPDLYNAFMEVVQTMVGMARELISQQDGQTADDIENPENDENDGDEPKGEDESSSDPSETKKEEMAMGKASLPMPHAAAHHNVTLPVGSYKEGDGHIKVTHGDNGKEGWVEARAGQVLSRDGHAISALNPNGR